MGLTCVSRDQFVVPRCTQACPAGIDVPRYIRAVYIIICTVALLVSALTLF
jgi:hypothetical protein